MSVGPAPLSQCRTVIPTLVRGASPGALGTKKMLSAGGSGSTSVLAMVSVAGSWSSSAGPQGGSVLRNGSVLYRQHEDNVDLDSVYSKFFFFFSRRGL